MHPLRRFTETQCAECALLAHNYIAQPLQCSSTTVRFWCESGGVCLIVHARALYFKVSYIADSQVEMDNGSMVAASISAHVMYCTIPYNMAFTT